jgi:RNA polymerase sigma-70 factor, ECF subfamily
MTQTDDEQFISLAKSGDLNAFNTLIERYQNAVYSVCYRLMGDVPSADDMTQEAFILAYRKIDSYHGGNFKAWLLRIATNRCYDELRKYQRQRTDYLEDLAPDNDDGAPLPSSAPSPEQITQQNELQLAIQSCIGGLNADQRLVLVMCDVQGFSYQEIAETHQLNLGTVKSRLARARLAMRECLQSVQELLPAEFRLFSNN